MSILLRLRGLPQHFARRPPVDRPASTGIDVAPRLSQRLGLRLQNSRFASPPGANTTVANLMQLEAEPTWVRLLFVNDQPEPWTVDGAAIAPSAAVGDGVTPVGADGRPDPSLWRTVTFEAGGADSTPPLDPIGNRRTLLVPGNPLDPSRPVHAWSDWCPVSALPRADGGFGVLLLVRTFSRGRMRFAACVGAPAPAIGRVHAGFVAEGDATSGAAPCAAVRDDTVFACHGMQAITTTPGATVVGVGDSISNSSCTTGEMSGFGLRACAMVSTRSRPVSYVNEGFPGRNSLGFATTGLWTVEAFRPQVAIIQAWTPNEPWTEAMAVLAFQRAMVVGDAVRRHGGVPILTTAVPCFGPHPEAEPVRATSNARIRALAEAGWPVLDLDRLWGTGDVPNRYQAALDAGDGLHPNDHACAVAARTLAPMLARILGE